MISPDLPTPPAFTSPGNTVWAVNLQGVGVCLQGRWLLQNITMQITAGSIVGLLGASGSGKSTLLRCIQGLQPLSCGHIHVQGKTGFMFQDFQLFPHFTVQENLTYAPLLHYPADYVYTLAQDMMNHLGLTALAQAYPKSLSGGQKQRVALARSLMMQPDVLLCDEPTSGLDIGTVNEVESLLKTQNTQGMTLVLASHDLSFLTRLCHRVIALKQGYMVKDIPNLCPQETLNTLTSWF